MKRIKEGPGGRVRGFEVVSAFADKGVRLPDRHTAGSAGYDFFLVEDVTIPPFGTESKPVIVPTGLKAYMPEDEVLMCYPRSSAGIRRNLIMANTVSIIDSDYYGNAENEGHIYIALRNLSDQTVHLKKGESVVQGIFSRFLLVDGDSATKVRTGGIGSRSSA